MTDPITFGFLLGSLLTNLAWYVTMNRLFAVRMKPLHPDWYLIPIFALGSALMYYVWYLAVQGIKGL